LTKIVIQLAHQQRALFIANYEIAVPWQVWRWLLWWGRATSC